MRLVRDLRSVQPSSPSAVTIGVFDGVHLGHQKIIKGMVTAARAASRAAVAYTFDPHPMAAIGHPAPPLLTSLEERAEIMATLGVDILIVPPFTAETARTRASEFVDLLIQHVRLAELWAGPDFALGYQREGNISFMTQTGRARGFEVRVVEPVQCRGGWVSSSRIRNALLDGDIDWTNTCLGRPYRLTGRSALAASDDQFDSLPAVELTVAPERLIPASGAYACRANSGDLCDQPCLAHVRGLAETGGDGAPIVVYPLDAEGGLRSGTMALDFVARVGHEAPGRAASRDRSLLLEETQRARALLSRPS